MFLQFRVSHLENFLKITRQKNKEPKKKLQLGKCKLKIVSNFSLSLRLLVSQCIAKLLLIKIIWFNRYAILNPVKRYLRSWKALMFQ